MILGRSSYRRPRHYGNGIDQYSELVELAHNTWDISHDHKFCANPLELSDSSYLSKLLLPAFFTGMMAWTSSSNHETYSSIASMLGLGMNSFVQSQSKMD